MGSPNLKVEFIGHGVQICCFRLPDPRRNVHDIAQASLTVRTHIKQCFGEEWLSTQGHCGCVRSLAQAVPCNRYVSDFRVRDDTSRMLTAHVLVDKQNQNEGAGRPSEGGRQRRQSKFG